MMVDEGLVREFLLRSYLNKWEDFNFIELIEQLINLFEYVLVIHGLMGYDEFKDAWVDYINAELPMDVHEYLSPFTIQNPTLHIGTDEVLDAIMELWYNEFVKAYSNDPIFIEVKNVYDELSELLLHGGSIQDYIIVIDKAIHLQHKYGNLLQDYGGVDIEEIKEEMEYEIELIEEEKRKREEAWERAYKGRWSE